MKGREKLGIRIGGIFSPGKLDDSFGKGTELEIHFVEGLGTWFGIGVSLSTHNFGRSLDIEKDFDYTGNPRTVEMEVYSLTVGFVTYRKIYGRITLSTDTGFGLYTSSAIIPSGIWEGRITKNDPGLYAGLDINYRLTERGLSVELSGRYNHIYSDNKLPHVIYAYTGQDHAGFFQLTIGVNIYTR